MKRIITDRNLAESGTITLGPEQTNYMKNVLRLRKGSRILLLDATGRQFSAEVRCFSPGGRGTTLAYGAPSDPSGGTLPSVTVLMCLLKARKMEQAIRQLAELGVHRIVPVLAQRSVPRIPPGKTPDRIARWKKICAEALRQSGRRDMPGIEAPIPLDDAVLQFKSGSVDLAAWEGEKERSAASLVFSHEAFKDATILIGPEGGLEADEAVTARNAGYTLVSLGPNILRSETAAVALASLVLLGQISN